MLFKKKANNQQPINEEQKESGQEHKEGNDLKLESGNPNLNEEQMDVDQEGEGEIKLKGKNNEEDEKGIEENAIMADETAAGDSNS